MRQLTILLLLILLLPVSALAGEIKGRIYVGNNPIGKDVPVEVRFGDNRYTTTTDADGFYRVKVPHRGRCMLRLWGRDDLAIAIDSKTTPQRYDLQIIQQGGKYILRLKGN